MPRNGFYNEEDDYDDDGSETEAYAHESQMEERRSCSRSRSRGPARDRGRERGRRRDGRHAQDGAEGGSGRTHPRSCVRIVSPAGSLHDVRSSTGGGNSLPSETELAERVAATVTANLTSKLTDLLAQKESSSESMAKEVEALRAAQKHSSLLNEATELSPRAHKSSL